MICVCFPMFAHRKFRGETICLCGGRPWCPVDFEASGDIQRWGSLDDLKCNPPMSL